MLSVIMPIYNMGDKVEKGLKSVLNQTYQDIEIIIIDDGSTDESYNICKSFAKKDSRIRLFHTENQGSGKARNYGIEHANGEYLYFIDADDELKNNAFDIMVRSIEKENVDLLVFGYQMINKKRKIVSEKKFPYLKKEDGKYIREHFQEFMRIQNDFYVYGVIWNKLFKTSIVKDKKLKFPDMRRAQDVVWVIQYLTHVKDVCFIEDVLYYYQMDDIVVAWEKLPVNYIDIINRFLQYRTDIILRWNTNNEEIKKMIYGDYWSEVMICLDIPFNPKLNYSAKEIKEEIKKTLDKAADVSCDYADLSMITQKISMFLIRHNMMNTLFVYLKLKIILKKILKTQAV